MNEQVRFGFGANWLGFVDELDETQIDTAVTALRELLGDGGVKGRRFLDVGCGSGLASLAAVRLGAREVVSFDYDPMSVEASERLRASAGIDPAEWRIERGSALDRAYVEGLGEFDIAYAWGVLHHTGEMWRAMDVVALSVATEGLLWLALYNDQGWRSGAWRRVKRRYNLSSPTARRLMVGTIMAFFESRSMLRAMVGGHGPREHLRGRRQGRGMAVRRDWIDWVGGYPFEVAKPDDVVSWARSLGFALERCRTVGGGWGCNEFLLRRRN